MATNHEQTLSQIIQATTSGPQDGLVGRLTPIVTKGNDPITTVMAMGALAYGRANTTNDLSTEEVATLKAWSALADKQAAAAPDSPEGLVARGGAILFSLLARRRAGEKIPAKEQRVAIRQGRQLIERAQRGSHLPLFDVLSAAAQRFFPVGLRDNKSKDAGAAGFDQHSHDSNATGVLARLLTAEHLLRRGQTKKLALVSNRLSQDLPNAACVKAFEAAAALGQGNKDDAEKHFSRAVELNSGDTRLRRAYAQILRANGKADKAHEVEG